MIPSGGKNFLPFLELPNKAYDKVGEVQKGDKVLVIDEFKEPKSAKIKSFIVGTVELANGKQRTLGLALNGYLEVAKYYGKDTTDWINKFLVYSGLISNKNSSGESFRLHTWVGEGEPLPEREFKEGDPNDAMNTFADEDGTGEKR